MKRLGIVAAFAAACLLLFAAPTAMAMPPFTPDGQVPIPYGNWIDQVLGLFVTAIVGVVSLKITAFLEGKIGKEAAERLSSYTEAAITFGINATRDAVRDKQLTVEVGNEVLERALEYGLRLFPDLIGRFGGVEAQRQRIMARLNLEASAQIPVPRPPATTFATEPERPPMAGASAE